MTAFAWLHLTDLHLGMAEQLPLLPAIKDRFFEDLKLLRERCGPWDLVLFTGDLTQSGRGEEFRKVDDFLGELWANLEKLDRQQPLLLVVPGNHDLARPSPKEPEVKVLKRWIDDADVRTEFWTDPQSPYRTTVNAAFTNYVEWWRKVSFKAPARPGLLPGDFSAVVEKAGASLGIVGLNSTFLQLTGGDYKGKLALDARQFQEVCDQDGPAWVKKHNVCLLLTHQPPDWLTPESEQQLRAEILGYNFFALHLFGHMHEAQYRTAAEGGGPVCRSSQGSSLFGLEHFGEGRKQQRSHGYSAGAIEIVDDRCRLTHWPRQAFRPGGVWNFAANTQDFLLTDEHTSPEEVRFLRSPKSGTLPVDLAEPQAPPAGENPFPRQWALLVGVNNYHYVSKLQYCRQDVIELARSFRETLSFHDDCVFEFHEEAALKPERDVIFRKLGDLRESGGIGPNDLLLFYFSGHGINVGDKDYLLPIQASPRDVKNLGIRVDDLVESLQETGCKNIVMFVDACREASQGAKGTAAIGEESKGAVAKAGIVSYFSCDPQDRSYEIEPLEHGSFTYCILQAIREGAATTAAELDSYLRENVPQVNTKYGKPLQQPYAVFEPAKQGNWPIFFNPIRSREEARKYEPLIDSLTLLHTEGKIGGDDFVRAVEFLDKLRSVKLPDQNELTKLMAIESLCTERWTLTVFRRVWEGVESRRVSMPQIKKPPRLK